MHAIIATVLCMSVCMVSHNNSPDLPHAITKLTCMAMGNHFMHSFIAALMAVQYIAFHAELGLSSDTAVLSTDSPDTFLF